MILFPPAKINLGLNILGKRPDGYHEIETCMYPIHWTDVLELLPDDKFKFIQTGFTVDCSQEDNLCVKAFRLMQKHFAVPNVLMHLRKNIPMGAGLGGGSSDAAFVLRGLNDLFSLGATNDELKSMASELGSDCPFFIEDKVQLAQGRGEIMNEIELDLSEYFLKVVHPDIHVGTKEAYANVRFPESTVSLTGLLRQPIATWKHTIENSFEATVISKHSRIGTLKSEMYAEGAIYAAMSGSGSSVFGIFNEMPNESEKDTCWIGAL